LKKKTGIVSLGCPKNRVDTEIMLGLLANEGFEITNDEGKADVIIINTCGFIESAKQESINTILEMAEHKRNNCKLLVVAGCLAERYKEEIINEIPDVDAVVGTGSYGDIVKVVEHALDGRKQVLCENLDAISYLRNERILTTPKGYAYLKIAEGCDNCCTYCIIPSLRGKYRSRDMDELVNETKALASRGVKEIILIAQDTTRYGLDIYGTRRLSDLIRRISGVEGINWIRILYCYPEDLDDDMISEIAKNKKVCNYIDIPIQHASDRMLKAMGRRCSRRQVENLISKLREKVPDIVIRTSLIVGFPGEESEDFEEMYRFVKQTGFDRLGVFMYSKEEGTPAAKLKNQVRRKVKEARYKKLMELQRKITEEKGREKLNREYTAVVEGVADDGIFYYGRTYAEAPDIDGAVYFTSSQPLRAGEFVRVKVLNTDEYDLIGEVTNEFAE